MKKSQLMPVWLRKMVLAQHNCNWASCRYFLSFFLSFNLTSILGPERSIWRPSAFLCTCKNKECYKYDLTAAQCFWLAHHNDWSRWFVFSSSPPICCPSFSFFVGVAKEYTTKLGCEKYFRRVTYWAQLEIVKSGSQFHHL